MAVPGDQNIVLKEQEKVNKYQGLRIEVQKLWNIKATVILVIIGALGIISNNFEKHFDEIGILKDIPSQQNTTFFGTVFILSRVLCMSKSALASLITRKVQTKI